MNAASRILTLIIMTLVVTAFAEPALAARLAQVKGEANETQASDSAEFKLSDESAVEVNYDCKKLGEKCDIKIKVYREQNGRWLVVNTVLSASNSSKGQSPLTLPAGRYRIKVTATHASYEVTVDN